VDAFPGAHMNRQDGCMANEGFSPVVPSEISDGLEIGREAFDEPHQLDNAVGFTFELARGTSLLK